MAVNLAAKCQTAAEQILVFSLCAMALNLTLEASARCKSVPHDTACCRLHNLHCVMCMLSATGSRHLWTACFRTPEWSFDSAAKP